MKIGTVIRDLNISGGTQRQALELATHLQNMGHDVKVYTAFYDKGKCYTDLLDRLNVKCLDYFYDRNRGLFKKFFSPWFNLIIWGKIYDDLANLIDEDLDLLCCHGQEVYAVGSKYKDRTGVPVVWQMNDLSTYVYKTNIKNLKDIIKFVLSPIRGNTFLKLRHIRYINKIDKIVVMDYLNKIKLIDNLGIESRVVRNGLDIEEFNFKERRFLGNKLRILSNGIFYPWRRLEDLVEALRIVKNEGIEFELNHIGTDIRCKQYAKKIYNMVKKLNLSANVKFHGNVSEEKLIELYSTSDIFVFPNYPQTWGLAVFEAMGCGVPVIVSTGCGASEVLTDGENALLIPPKSPEKIVDAIIRLKNRPDLWRKLSINGRKFVEKNIRWDLYVENMLKIFNVVIQEKIGLCKT